MSAEIISNGQSSLNSQLTFKPIIAAKAIGKTTEATIEARYMYRHINTTTTQTTMATVAQSV